MVNLTAAALNGVPSWNLTPFLSLKVYVLASGETSHESARPGTNLPGSGSHTSGSHTFSVMRMVESKFVTCGSSVSSTSKPSPYTSVPPPAVAAAGAVVGAAVGCAAGAAVGAGALVGAAGGVVGFAAGAAVGAAGAACWQAARPMALAATVAQRRNSRRGIDDISDGPPHQRCACTATWPLARIARAMSGTGTEPNDRTRSWNARNENARPSRAWVSRRKRQSPSQPARYMHAAPGTRLFLTASACAAPGDM